MRRVRDGSWKIPPENRAHHGIQLRLAAGLVRGEAPLGQDNDVTRRQNAVARSEDQCPPKPWSSLRVRHCRLQLAQSLAQHLFRCHASVGRQPVDGFRLTRRVGIPGDAAFAILAVPPCCNRFVEQGCGSRSTGGKKQVAISCLPSFRFSEV